jgi:hypothetical protein
VLAKLWPYLPEERFAMVTEAVDVACSISDAHSRAQTLIGLASGLPEEYLPRYRESLMREALSAVLTTGDSESQSGALAELILHMKTLPPRSLYPLWCQALHGLAIRSREDLLAALPRLAPVLIKLGGKDAITATARAILSAAQWWPA